MLNKFIEFIEKNSLFKANQKILLAVSGGIDSVAMTYLFKAANFDFAIAHCNFQLRGKDSDYDQEFVRNLALLFGKEFYTVNFDTKIFATNKGISIQMAARELRYEWFEKIANAHKFSRIAIAHNRDDIVETFIINIARGTGIEGLTGIKPKQGKIIRPVLFASRADISDFISSKKIIFREDSSNADIKYQRNLIRHKILPLLKEINPSFAETVIQETEIFNATNAIYNKEIVKIKKSLTIKEFPHTVLSIDKILSHGIIAPILYDLLNEYGFSYAVVKDILHSIESQSGKKFYSEHFVILKDRDTLIIKENTDTNQDNLFFINEECSELNIPIKLTFKHFRREADFIATKSQDNINLDYGKLKFPLLLRHWNKGDYFYPLGLGGRKKLSDYFTNQKINLFDKENIWLLMSGDDIVWIIGWQIDERFKITDQTENILSICLKY
jgi:tRNA(Ile)-lysidine synthase